MIKVCTVKGRSAEAGVGECWSFPNAKLGNALAFARIGSQHGRVRRVMLCGRFARVYANGIKARGELTMSELRQRARSCR
jgi:hypothetical protein